MEPNNIENQIKNSLQNREVQPSPKAWDRLDAMLTVAEEKKSKKVVLWNPKYFAIAAAFLLIGTLVFINLDKSESENNNTIVVKEIKDNTKMSSENETIFNPKKETEIATAEIDSETVKEKFASKIPNKIQNKQINHQSENEIINPKNNQEIAEVVIKKGEERPTILSVSDSDLLANVDKASKSNNQKTVQINSRDLLFQVTSEINQEYRETNFQKLKRNFETVKVAISTRNNQ